MWSGVDSMIDTDKYEGHTEGPWNNDCSPTNITTGWYIGSKWGKDDRGLKCIAGMVNGNKADAQLIADAPLFLEFIEKVVEEWARPNACPKSFGKEVRSLLLEYGLINFNEETRRYEVKE